MTKIMMAIAIAASLLLIGVAVSAGEAVPPFGSTTSTIEKELPTCKAEIFLTVSAQVEK